MDISVIESIKSKLSRIVSFKFYKSDDTNTNPETTKPKEKVEKIPTVIERPDTPVGGTVKATGKNSPSQKKTKG